MILVVVIVHSHDNTSHAPNNDVKIYYYIK